MRIKAFSLVETTLALGICAFALIAILGLIPVGLRASADSTRETHAVQLLGLLAGAVQTAMDHPSSVSPSTDPFRPPLYGISLQPDTAGTLYASLSGSILSSAHDAVYKIAWKCQTVHDLNTVSIGVYWPAGAADEIVSSVQAVVILTP